MLKKILFSCLLTSVVVPGYVFATTLIFDHTDSTWEINNILGVGTSDEDMVGLEVTVNFVGGGSETATWELSGAGGSGAWGSSWSLSMSDGSTYINSMHFTPWNFSVDQDIKISRIFIDAGTGASVFDATRTMASLVATGLQQSTPGSQSGSPFTYIGMNDPFNTIATYSGEVVLQGMAHQGDLYRYLTLDFGTAVQGSFQFSADTDSFGDTITPIPEPATMILFGNGLLVLSGFTRRKK